MPAPIDDDDPPFHDSYEDASFTTWAVSGGLLVLVYILIFVLLRPA